MQSSNANQPHLFSQEQTQICRQKGQKDSKQQIDLQSTIQLKSSQESKLLGEGTIQTRQNTIRQKIHAFINSPAFKILIILSTIFSVAVGLAVYANYDCTKKNTSQFLQDNMCNPLKKYIKSLRFYDIHYFLQDSHNKDKPKIVLLAANSEANAGKQSRQLLPLSKTKLQYEQLIQKMMKPWCRFRSKLKTVKDSQPNQITDQHFNLAYFFYQLQKYPENQQYKQVEYYRYDKIYNIGKYDKQLPICAVMVGKNNFKVIDKMYTSIERQNYTNYKIVHVDDNSNDGTIHKITQYLKNKPKLNGKVTLITEPYQRNALFNRNLGIRNYCGQNDIVLDMDADDWLIGSQVFQLVNSVYQNGNNYKGNNYEVWSAYFSFIEGKWCDPVPRLVGPIPQQIISNQTYRIADLWRTTHLRTYLKALHDKIDETDFLDKTQNNGQFFVETSDSFTQRSIVQLTAPKHMVILDEFVYYYQASPTPKILTEFKHSFLQSQALLPYYPLESLADKPKRHPQNLLTAEKQKLLKQFRVQIRNRRDKMEQTIKSMYY